jgi:hypothetical protein
MPTLLKKLLGENWRSSSCGIIAAICTFIIGYPQALEPLPEYWENLIKNLAVFIMGAGFVQWGRSTRDHVVSENKAQEFAKKIEEIEHKYEI